MRRARSAVPYLPGNHSLRGPQYSTELSVIPDLRDQQPHAAINFPKRGSTRFKALHKFAIIHRRQNLSLLNLSAHRIGWRIAEHRGNQGQTFRKKYTRSAGGSYQRGGGRGIHPVITPAVLPYIPYLWALEILSIVFLLRGAAIFILGAGIPIRQICVRTACLLARGWRSPPFMRLAWPLACWRFLSR